MPRFTHCIEDFHSKATKNTFYSILFYTRRLQNSVEIREHERDTPKLNAWSTIPSTDLILPFFFLDRGQSLNVNGKNYLRMLQQFCVPRMIAVADMQQVIFQKDGARPH